MGGIWVRSQNREELLNVKAVTYQEEDLFGNKNKIIGWVASECSFVIGEYATKERALQVLDEIHARIASGTIEAHEGETGTWHKVEKYGVVYIMPET
jgi:hypothetical protein